MSQLPTPPTSRGVSAEPLKPSADDKSQTSTEPDGKIQWLDELLERYLILLDSHQKLQESLGKQLASGFFQLAHANYCSPGRRFGEDFYDERMKATRRLKIISSPQEKEEHKEEELTTHLLGGDLERVNFEVEYKSVLNAEDQKEAAEDKQKAQVVKEEPHEGVTDPSKSEDEQDSRASKETEHIKQLLEATTLPPSPPPPSLPQTQGTTDENADATEKRKPHGRKLFRSDDPISWYGILVPPSLKSAQRSFVEAVDGGIPQLCTVVQEMCYVESLVYELRRQINSAT